GSAAQACAYAAHERGVPCRVFMFDTAPPPKVEGVKRWGASPIFMPRNELLAWLAAEEWRNEPETFLHPFADPEVIAGHGGLGLELLDEVHDLERVIVPVGGGGLISGTASALRGSRPGIEVIGVQADSSAPWPTAIAVGRRGTLGPRT